MTQILCLFFIFFSFFFYFYHGFIVFRYKKLRAALAMEKTKSINQNKRQKKPIHSSTAATEKPLLAQNHSDIVPYGNKIKRKLASQTTSRLRALCKEILCRKIKAN